MDRLAEPSRPRKLEYRWFIAGAEVDPEAFWAELRRLGGRAVVEAVDVSAYRPTAKGEAALRRTEGEAR
jgi:hypothetical protein